MMISPLAAPSFAMASKKARSFSEQPIAVRVPERSFQLDEVMAPLRRVMRSLICHEVHCAHLRQALPAPAQIFPALFAETVKEAVRIVAAGQKEGALITLRFFICEAALCEEIDQCRGKIRVCRHAAPSQYVDALSGKGIEQGRHIVARGVLLQRRRVEAVLVPPYVGNGWQQTWYAPVDQLWKNDFPVVSDGNEPFVTCKEMAAGIIQHPGLKKRIRLPFQLSRFQLFSANILRFPALHSPYSPTLCPGPAVRNDDGYIARDLVDAS